MTFAPGARLGPYEILGTAGAGGMGEVYRARDTRLGRTVAIKVLPAEIRHDDERRRRLQREAEAIAALSHPHICALHDVSSDGGVDFLVMEYVEGETLEARLKRGPLPLGDVLRVGTEISQALSAAHRAGIVHRDLKPSNVMLTRSGVKLLDFGLAKRQLVPEGASASGVDTATQPGVVVGTVPYMAPEQLQGRPIDSRADIFAFGAVLFEMITGRRAFPGDSPPQVFAAILGAEPPAPSRLRRGVPRSLDRIVLACLAREPDERWESAFDVLRQLQWVGAEVENPPERQSRWRLHAAWAAVVAALAMLVLPLWGRGARIAAPPPNPRPVIVLMDSPLPGRVYDPSTLAAGGTNADDLSDALRELPVAIQKENTSAEWHREDQVLRENPDLIISHLSCLLDQRVAEGRLPVFDHLVRVAGDRLLLFFAYVAASNPRTRFLVYSRSHFVDPAGAERWVKEREARLPALRGRLHTFSVPGGREAATFRDPDTAGLMRERTRQLLGLR
jgi:predicted Ser/Thr protein kinase